MSQTRVTVVLHDTTARIDGNGDTILEADTEWAHEHQTSSQQLGIELRWEDSRSFFPWSSVARVDREPCVCAECKTGKTGSA